MLMAMCFLLWKKNTIAINKDMQNKSIMLDLHLDLQCNGEGYLIPHVLYVLQVKEKRKVLKTICSIQIHFNECENFAKLVNVEKEMMYFIKIHN